MFQNRNDIIIRTVLSLLKGKKHLMSISRELKASPATLSRALKLMLDDGIVDYYSEGKNKVFSLKKNISSASYIYIAENYKRDMLFKKYPNLSVIIEDVLKLTDAKLVVLFGSYSNFSADKKSDIDIYIWASKEVKNNIEKASDKLNIKIGKLDPNDNLTKEIIKNHVILRGVEEFYEQIHFFA